MFQSFRSFVESHFGLVILTGFLFGMCLPGVGAIPSIFVPFLLSSVIFFGCAKVTMDDVRDIRIKDILGFYVFRFCVFPFIVFYMANAFLPEFRYALLMVALLPCGVTLAAVTSILGGNAALGLSATALTSFLAPLTIPLAFALVSDIDIQLDVLAMGRALAMIIFIPIGFYFGIFRRWRRGKLFVRSYASFVAVIQIGIVATIIIASQRQYILDNIGFMAFAAAMGTLVYFVFYGLGWGVFRNRDFPERVSYALVSGATNIALGISLAFLYFPPREISMLVAYEASWIFALSAFQFFLKMRRNSV